MLAVIVALVFGSPAPTGISFDEEVVLMPDCRGAWPPDPEPWPVRPPRDLSIRRDFTAEIIASADDVP